jgi:hypothetical protein
MFSALATSRDVTAPALPDLASFPLVTRHDPSFTDASSIAYVSTIRYLAIHGGSRTRIAILSKRYMELL